KELPAQNTSDKKWGSPHIHRLDLEDEIRNVYLFHNCTYDRCSLDKGKSPNIYIQSNPLQIQDGNEAP
ncbi:hypothetical protein, partial [Vibrio anguillarum]